MKTKKSKGLEHQFMDTKALNDGVQY